jgi:hypothetical protein
MCTLNDNLVLPDERITEQDNSTGCGLPVYDAVLADRWFQSSEIFNLHLQKAFALKTETSCSFEELVSTY